ncbi:MAG TPA: LysR family transcriptional regulator [Stellaceae bacterium]|nr:LysR family transcriptional regulator [Stellaceae bacterium]
MDLRQLRYFVAIAEARSLATAARLVGVSQPALTKAVKGLEASLGCRLFDRRSRGVALTQLGEEFLARCQLILAEVARTRSEMDALRSVKGGELHIGTLRAAANAQMPAAVSRFSISHPQVRLNIEVDQNSNLVAGLARGKFDLVIGVGEGDLERAGLHYEPLWSDRLVFAARGDHPLKGKAVTPAMLAAQPWIMPEGGPYRQRIENYFFSVGIHPPSPRILCAQVPFIRGMLIEDDYLALLPAESIEYECSSGLMTSFMLDSPFLTRPIGLLTRQDKVLSPASKSFAAALRELVTGKP